MSAPSVPPPSGRRLTDLGNAERLVDLYGDDVRYSQTLNRWLIWDGRRFAADDDGAIMRVAKNTVRSIYREAAECSGTDAMRAALAKCRRHVNPDPCAASEF